MVKRKDHYMRLGIDVGSTTVKLVLLDENDKVTYSRYERHMSNVFKTVVDMLREMYETVGDIKLRTVITGSGGLSSSNILKIPFEQEVVTCSAAVEALIPQTDVAIELGGEDAKITFYGQTIEQRMNGTCAGGTGAFIDQMAALLNTDASGLNEAAKKHTMIYPIAARCGVFAKTDIQPLINEGAPIEDSVGFDIPGGSQPDYQRTGMRAHDKRQGGVPGRTAVIPFGAQETVHRHAGAQR